MSEVEKEKWRAYYRAYRAAHKEEYREYRRRYLKTHKEERREYQKQYQGQYRKIEENRLKHYARNKVRYAIQHDKLTKQPCEVCGAVEVEAHHCDYNKPLDVMWLCKKHHADWHRSNTPIF